MRKRGLSQEGLKILACMTMLIDHFAAVLLFQLFPMSQFLFDLYGILRIIGRLAFPVYCFLLAEGAHYTRDPKKYALRLALGALLSELPYDYALYGGINWQHQNVMVTLLLGFLFAVTVSDIRAPGCRILLLVPFIMLAELIHADYGGWGVAMIGLFVVTGEIPNRHWVQALGLAVIAWMIGGMTIGIGPIRVPVQLFCVAAMVPIALYDGQKRTNSKWVQWTFYLFYPAHLLALYCCNRLMRWV